MSNEETTSIRETLTGNPVYEKDISFYALRGCVLMAHDHQRMVCKLMQLTLLQPDHCTDREHINHTMTDHSEIDNFP